MLGGGREGADRQVITTVARRYILAARQAWDYFDAFQMFLFSYSNQARTSCFQFKKCGCSAWSLNPYYRIMFLLLCRVSLENVPWKKGPQFPPAGIS